MKAKSKGSFKFENKNWKIVIPTAVVLAFISAIGIAIQGASRTTEIDGNGTVMVNGEGNTLILTYEESIRLPDEDESDSGGQTGSGKPEPQPSPKAQGPKGTPRESAAIATAILATIREDPGYSTKLRAFSISVGSGATKVVLKAEIDLIDRATLDSKNQRAFDVLEALAGLGKPDIEADIHNANSNFLTGSGHHFVGNDLAQLWSTEELTVLVTSPSPLKDSLLVEALQHYFPPHELAQLNQAARSLLGSS